MNVKIPRRSEKDLLEQIAKGFGVDSLTRNSPTCELSVEIANKEGIKTVTQPGGSIKDNLSIEYCDKNEMKMVFTGIRHFKH